MRIYDTSNQPFTHDLNSNVSPKELANHVLNSFFTNLSFENCQSYLWQLLTQAVSGGFSQLSSAERLNLMCFMEQLNELLAASSEAYGLKARNHQC